MPVDPVLPLRGDSASASHVCAPIEGAGREDRTKGGNPAATLVAITVLITGITVAATGFWGMSRTILPADLVRMAPAIVGMLIVVLSVILAALVWTLGRARARVINADKDRIAELRTSEAAARDALRETEALRNTLDTHAIVSVADARGRITSVNDTFCKISGYSREELIGQDHRVLNSGVHPKEFWVAMWKTIASGNAWHGEVCNRAKDGSLYWVDSIIAPFRGADGRIEKYVSIRSDITESKLAENALRVSEDRLRFALEAIDTGDWELDLVSYSAHRSLKHDQIFGYENGLSTWTYEMFLEHVLPEDRDFVDRHFRQALATRGDWKFECRIVRRDGEQRWILACGRHRFDSSGRPLRMAGVVQDITARKQAEAKSHDAEVFLRSAIDSLDSHTVVLSSDARVLLANRAWREFAVANKGSGRDVLEGADYLAACDKARSTCPEAGEVADGIRRVLAGEAEPAPVAYACHSPTERRWFLCSIRGFSRGHERFAVVSHLSISAVKLAEATLRRLSQVQEEMGQMARVGGWELEAATGRLTWTDQMYEIFEVPRTFVPELASSLEYFPGEFKAIVAGHVQRTTDTGEPFDFTVPFTTAAGHTLWVRSIGKAERRADGRVRLYGAFQDVTEAHLKNAELVTARDAAEAANRAKSQFLANMSHEIRTPLTAILGYTDILREDGDITLAPQTRLRTLDTIRSAGQHLMSVINNILDLSKIEADRMSVQAVPMPLPPILADVAAIVGPKAKDKGIAFTVQLETPIPERILSEPTYLRQIITNLAANAVKFTEAGSVTIKVRAINLAGGSRLQIDVQDSGPGMTTAQAALIFSPFTQADSGMARRFGGTGLGLTISRKLAMLMGGNVTLECTEPGKGSTFRLDLPLEPAPGSPLTATIDLSALQPAHTHTPATARLSGRILLAEDGPENQRLIAFHLRKAGATVEVAENGRVALSMLESADAAQRPFDLLVTDMQMPEMDGYALTRELRSRGSSLAILALTAHAMDEDRVKCIQAGCDDYASKPIDKAALIATCARWIGVRSGYSVPQHAA